MASECVLADIDINMDGSKSGTAIKVPWTWHEAVILLNAYLLVSEGKVSRQSAISLVSKQLRQMGINNGIEIDSIYRNENGITFQMHAMESAYRGETIIKPATKLFIEVVKLYKNNPDAFSRLLKEAEAMADDSRKQETQFMTWLANQVTPAQLSVMYMTFKEIEQFAIKEQVVKESLFEQIDLTTVKRIRGKIDSSRLFKYTHKTQLGRMFSALRYLSMYLEERRSNAVS